MSLYIIKFNTKLTYLYVCLLNFRVGICLTKLTILCGSDGPAAIKTNNLPLKLVHDITPTALGIYYKVH